MPKSKPLKDFEVVAHVITLATPRVLTTFGEPARLLAIYINRYGLDVGGLVETNGGRNHISYDYPCWQELTEMEFSELAHDVAKASKAKKS